MNNKMATIPIRQPGGAMIARVNAESLFGS